MLDKTVHNNEWLTPKPAPNSSDPKLGDVSNKFETSIVKTNKSMKSRIFIFTGIFFLTALKTYAQGMPDLEASTSSYWMSMIVLAVVVTAGVVFLLTRSRSKSQKNDAYSFENRLTDDSRSEFDVEEFDADSELEWFRQARGDSKTKKNQKPNKLKAERRNGGDRRKVDRLSGVINSAPSINEEELSTQGFQERLRRIQYNQLPINSFIQLTVARTYDQLPLTSDQAVHSAIEQVQDEFEEDEMVRELAVRVLARFRYKNSVEALAQVALYDLSSNIRAKAVNVLADFDHESVFETVLLTCADPTREVRAAAARGLFRLSFDRAEAWKRIIGTGDEFRMRLAARAAIESQIVEKSLSRLIHDDMKIAYEAFVLVALLLKAGEHEFIFNTLKGRGDQRIKLALLHVLGVVGEERSIIRLADTPDDPQDWADVTAKKKEVVENTMAVAV